MYDSAGGCGGTGSDGEHIATEAVSRTTHSDLVTWMAGREVKDLYPRAPVERGEVLLEVDGVSGANIDRFSLNVHAGEIVAVFMHSFHDRIAILRKS